MFKFEEIICQEEKSVCYAISKGSDIVNQFNNNILFNARKMYNENSNKIKYKAKHINLSKEDKVLKKEIE